MLKIHCSSPPHFERWHHISLCFSAGLWSSSGASSPPLPTGCFLKVWRNSNYDAPFVWIYSCRAISNCISMKDEKTSVNMYYDANSPVNQVRFYSLLQSFQCETEAPSKIRPHAHFICIKGAFAEKKKGSLSLSHLIPSHPTEMKTISRQLVDSSERSSFSSAGRPKDTTGALTANRHLTHFSYCTCHVNHVGLI